jgi:phosphoribosylamine--glycine ligase
VVKASGLAAGMGVVVPASFDEAQLALRACLEHHRFGAAGHTVVLEEQLFGQELSFFVLTDGVRACDLDACQDHKRLHDGDTGPNTGGMGAYSPAPVCTEAVRARVMASVVEPTLAGLRAEGWPFRGVVFFGLMIDAQGEPSVIEYNVRFGDPEVQPLLFGLRDPVVPALLGAARGELAPGRLSGRPAATVVVASPGYPDTAAKGLPIRGIERADAMRDVHVFHAGTRRDADGTWRTNGGRVLGVCARADDLSTAVARAYDATDQIELEGALIRRDIGWRAR